MKRIIPFILFSPAVYASGGSHIFAITVGNFLVFFIPLIIFLRKALRDLFEKNALKTEEIYNVAQKKDEEAMQKLAVYEKKVKSIEQEKNQILADFNKESENFSQAHRDEIEKILTKMKNDHESKLKNEERLKWAQLNAELVEKVIGQAKETIRSNEGFQTKATNKLVAQLQ